MTDGWSKTFRNCTHEMRQTPQSGSMSLFYMGWRCPWRVRGRSGACHKGMRIGRYDVNHRQINKIRCDNLSSRDGEFAGSLPLPADPAFADRFPQDDPLAAMSL